MITIIIFVRRSLPFTAVDVASQYFGKAKANCRKELLECPRELSIVLLLVVLLVLLGFFPQPILDTSHSAMSNIQQWFVNSVSTTRP